MGGWARGGGVSVVEECSTNERIGQVGVTHNNLGCTLRQEDARSLSVAAVAPPTMRQGLYLEIGQAMP